MDTLTTASEILSQLKQLTDGMASIHQDVDMLKRESTFQRDPSREADDDRTADEMGEDFLQHITWPLETSSSSSPPKAASNGQGRIVGRGDGHERPIAGWRRPDKGQWPHHSRSHHKPHQPVPWWRLHQKDVKSREMQSAKSVHLAAEWPDQGSCPWCNDGIRVLKGLDQSLYTLQRLLLEPMDPLASS